MNVKSYTPVIIFNMWNAVIQNITGCNSEKDSTYPAMNFGQITSRNQSEDIPKHLQLPQTTKPNEEIPEFLDALNNTSNEIGKLNWDSLHPRLNSHYEAWIYKKQKDENHTGKLLRRNPEIKNIY